MEQYEELTPQELIDLGMDPTTVAVMLGEDRGPEETPEASLGKIAAGNPLKDILAKAQSGESNKPIVAFDIDDTLVHNTYAQVVFAKKILQELGDTYPEEAAALTKILPQLEQEYKADPTMASLQAFSPTALPSVAGITNPKFLGEYAGKWFKMLGTPDHLNQTKSMPGGPEYIKALQDAGASIAYITSRKESQIPAVLKTLELAGYPAPNDQNVFLSTQSGVFDVENEWGPKAQQAWKKWEHLLSLSEKGQVIGFIDNDTTIANTIAEHGQEKFPDLTVVRLDTKEPAKSAKLVCENCGLSDSSKDKACQCGEQAQFTWKTFPERVPVLREGVPTAPDFTMGEQTEPEQLAEPEAQPEIPEVPEKSEDDLEKSEDDLENLEEDKLSKEADINLFDSMFELRMAKESVRKHKDKKRRTTETKEPVEEIQFDNVADDAAAEIEKVAINDIVPIKEVKAEANRDSVVPDFIKHAAYSYEETREETLEKDYKRLICGLSDYVLAEQLTERELCGMGKPVAENYAEYFQETLKECRKSRKKAEERLYKLMPRHSQLGTKEFFDSIQEQNAKEKEAREKAIEQYPPAGVEKLERKDVVRKGLKKEAVRPMSEEEKQTFEKLDPVWLRDASEASAEKEQRDADLPKCAKCGEPAPFQSKKTKEALCASHISGMTKEAIIKVADYICTQCDIGAHERCRGRGCDCACNAEPDVKKEATKKWKAGERLVSKHDGKVAAYVAYVNECDKTYTIKISGVMYPSYYSFEDAYDVFEKAKDYDPKDTQRGV